METSRIKPPISQKIWRFSSAHFYRKVISEINNLWYNILEVIKQISGTLYKLHPLLAIQDKIQ